MKLNKTYTGINIQWPISDLIISLKKTIETRTYQIPTKLIGKELLLIETPGKTKEFKSRIRGIIVFNDCFKYETPEEFYLDSHMHCVLPDSLWAWKDIPKYGWRISSFRPTKIIELHCQKGIIYTHNLNLDGKISKNSSLCT
jgi:hypothetical protein